MHAHSRRVERVGYDNAKAVVGEFNGWRDADRLDVERRHAGHRKARLLSFMLVVHPLSCQVWPLGESLTND